MRNFDAVLFDLDGTLADSLGDISGAMNETLAARGLPTHRLDDYRQMVGEGVEVLARRALPASAAAQVAAVVDDYRERYRARLTQDTRLYPGVPAMLDGLHERGLVLAVLSNKRDDFTGELVRQLFGRWPFAQVRGEQVGVPRKPDPQAALDIARAVGVAPARWAFVGDTPIDMKTARAAGMLPVGVTWGFRSADELRAAGAAHLISEAAALLALV